MNRFIKSLINSTINCFSHHKLYKIVNSLIDDIDIKYFSHHKLPKIVNSLIINNDDIYHYHNLTELDHLYNINIYNAKIYLYYNFSNINFIFYEECDFNYNEISLSLDKIYIIHNSSDLITNIIGIDIRCTYPYNINY
jgi:hypothetical protein